MNEETKIDSFKRSLRSDPFSAADRAFVAFLEKTYEEENPFVLAAAALCLAATREGHSYFDLSSTHSLPPSLTAALGSAWPTQKEWREIATSSPSIGIETERLPLLLVEPSALYLRKYYEYEELLARSLVQKAILDSSDPQGNVSKGREDRFDPPSSEHEADRASLPYPAQDNLSVTDDSGSDDLQQQAITQALKNRLYIISGGPGTGKTTTVLGYLTQAILSHQSDKPLRIAAVAPTGKAAARLSESIRSGMERLDLNESLNQQLLDIPCMTVHRLLQGLPNRISFRRNRKAPLEYDIIVVDETSMIDLPLMQKLMDAVPAASSIVFLGDHHQLTSVEVGSVFGDMTRSARDPQSPLYGKSTTLKKTYRFSEDSSIYQFCEICKGGKVEELEDLLLAERDDFAFHSIESASRKSIVPVLGLIADAHEKRLQSPDLETAYQSISHFIALTPFNRGELGSWSLNRFADTKIRRIHDADPDSFYQGMPLIILENNYDLELFNGDMGIVWPDPHSGELFAWFNDLEKGLKHIRLNWLPKHDLAYCLTIHKSQGSEFDQVVGIFAPDENEFVSRELIYTCASRAKAKFTLFGEKDSLKSGIQRSVKRATRLEEQILEASP